jgi:hypothetical protein
MQPKKTLPLPQGLLTYFNDDISIGVLLQTSKNTVCNILDPDTLSPMGVFLIKEKVTSPTIHIGNDILYLTTDSGILGYDSFSGQHAVKCTSSNLIPLDFCYGDNRIYAVCGIPIANNKQVNTDNICLASYDAQTGKNIYQGQSISGSFLSPVYYNNKIWCVIGQNLYEHTTQCEIAEITQLSFVPSYSPIVNDNFVCVASENGHMEIFDANLHKYLKIFVEKNNSAPIFNQNIIFWAGLENLYLIDVEKRSTQKIPLNYQITSNITYSNGVIYGGDKLGNLVSININEKIINSLPISKFPLWKPLVLGNYVFAASQIGLHQCQLI